MADAIKTWQEKLAYLQQQEAIASDAGQKFALGKQIEEAKQRIDELAAEIADDKGPVQRIAPTKLTRGADHLFGREQELSALDQIWNDPSKKVLTIVAWGGVGKTALVFEWMAQQAAKNWPGFERVFDWSFFSQGTREEGGASADTFVAAALRFFGDETMADTSTSAWDKGARLAQLVAQQRSLLVLDGIEPLQHPPGPLAGELKDPALATLLKGLARQNSGLCIVTTRERVTDLAAFRATTAPEWELHHLSIPAGIELLTNLGVRGTSAEFEAVVKEVKGHALTLNLLGRFLAKAHQGDIRKRHQVKFEKADAKIQGGYAFKTIGAYERWLREGGEDGRRALAVLRLLGLFDRPADDRSLKALRCEPPIEGLTELLTGLDDADWNIAVASLADCGLVSIQSNKPTLGVSQSAIDGHPLIREYFAKQLMEKNVEGWRKAHGRLYDFLCESTGEPDEPTLEDLQPLYQAVAHGCHAHRGEEARSRVYRDRILRRNEEYSWRKLGALGSDLGAIACFFKQPWSEVLPDISEGGKVWLLASAAFFLRALGRLSEALEPMRVVLKRDIEDQSWEEAGVSAGNLSELELILGAVVEAVADAERAVSFADCSGIDFQRMAKRTTHADALHQIGLRAEAEARFCEAEQMQAKRQPHYPFLYSLAGFRYCELLLASPERAAWQRQDRKSEFPIADLIESSRSVARRAAQMLEWSVSVNAGLFPIALDHLILGRAALYGGILESSSSNFRVARSELNLAVDGLRSSGQQFMIASGLLTRAWLRSLIGSRIGPESAQADLDEAWEIAERGPMRLLMADIHLYRARLFGPRSGNMKDKTKKIEYPWNKNSDGSLRGPLDDLSAARKLIEQCSYGRRREELDDAEEASKTW